MRFGGQTVGIKCEVGHLEVVRPVAQAVYRRGARFVDVEIDDPWLVRSRARYASFESLTYAPRWPEQRIHELDEEPARSSSGRRNRDHASFGPGMIGCRAREGRH
ncbi:MAG: aminopeptidase [Solirubrobacteraceae bacterium]